MTPEPKIRRKLRLTPITLSTATEVATTLRWDDVAGGALRMGTSSTNVTTLQIWASESLGGTFGRLYDAAGAAADVVLSASSTQPRVYALPDAAYGCGAIKVVSVSTNSTSAQCIVIAKT